MNRLSFGLPCCSDIFQAIMARILEGLPECVAYLDDLLVMGETMDMMDKLDKVLRRLKENGIRLKKNKCESNLQEVRYLDWLVTSSQLKPIPEKMEAIQKLHNLKDVPILRSLLGAVGYYSQLLLHLATTLAPLYELLKKGVKWQWTRACKETVNKVKQMLTSDLVVVKYDPKLPVKLVTDTSEVGIGATLMQVWPRNVERPVAYASRILTPTEKKYRIVEKEAVAVSYGIRRFHQYFYGERFTLVTDNKSLSKI